MVARIKDILNSVHKKGFFYLFLANILVGVIGFCSQFFVAIFLDPVDIGRVKIFQTYIQIFSLIGGLGLSTSVLKICSERRTKEEIKNFFSVAFFLALIGNIFVTGIVAVLAAFNLLSTDTVLNSYLLTYSSVSIFFSLNALIVAYIQSQKKLKPLAFLMVITKSILLIGLIFLTKFYLLEGYFAGLWLGMFVAISILIFFVRKDIVRISSNIKSYYKEHFRYSFFSLGANLSSILATKIDILMINFFVNDKVAIGYYSFAAIIIMGLSLYSASVQQFVTPYFSEKSSDKVALYAAVNKAEKIQVFTTTVLVFVLCIALPLGLSLLFNQRFDSSTPYLIPLLIAWGIRNLFIVRSVAFLGMGKMHINFYLSLFLLGFGSLLSFFVLREVGIQGIAYAIICVNFMGWFLSFYIFNRIKKRELCKAK